MTRSPRVFLIAGSLSLAGGAAFLLASVGDGTADRSNTKCCFTNPRYSGVCEVTLEKDQTCADVLSYLDNPNSVGKDYCDNTTVRGGWEEVTCEGR